MYQGEESRVFFYGHDASLFTWKTRALASAVCRPKSHMDSGSILKVKPLVYARAQIFTAGNSAALLEKLNIRHLEAAPAASLGAFSCCVLGKKSDD